MKTIIIRCLLTLCLLYLPGTTLAAPDGYKEWNIPQFGAFFVPADVNIAAISNLKEFIEQHQPKKQPNTMDAVDNQPLLEKKQNLPDMDLGIYQLTRLEGNAYHQAWILAINAKQPNPELISFFQGAPNPEKKKLADGLYANIKKDMAGFSYTDPKTGFSFRMIELAPPEVFALSNHTAVGAQIRAMLKVHDFLFPLTIRGYAVAPNGKFSALLLYVEDSDRKYWEQFMTTMFKKSVPPIEI